MKSSSRSQRASRVQRTDLLERLRAEIADGRRQPEMRLPPLRELARDYGVSYVTAHRALAQLTDEGFIRNSRQQGLFVADRPPNRTRFALIFPHRPVSHRPWSRYWSALERAAQQLQGELDIEFPIRYDIEAGSHQTEDFDKLVHEVQTDQLAGLIFAHSPHNLKGTPVLDHPGVPRVALMSAAGIAGVHAVGHNARDWFKPALAHVREAGCRRVAVLLAATDHGLGGAEGSYERLAALAEEHQLELRRSWLQSVHPHLPTWTSHVVQAVFDPALPARQRPDALLVHDDNLVADAQRGLVAVGLADGLKVKLVAHCNLPSAPPQVMPMWRVGLDARDLFAACVQVIQALRRGESAPALTRVSMIEEPEIRQREITGVGAEAWRQLQAVGA